MPLILPAFDSAADNAAPTRGDDEDPGRLA
jgi:hypothetical protein